MTWSNMWTYWFKDGSGNKSAFPDITSQQETKGNWDGIAARCLHASAGRFPEQQGGRSPALCRDAVVA